MPKDSRTRRERIRNAQRRARAAMSDEALDVRRARERARRRREREEETPEMRAQRLLLSRDRMRYKRTLARRQALDLLHHNHVQEEETPEMRAKRQNSVEDGNPSFPFQDQIDPTNSSSPDGNVNHVSGNQKTFFMNIKIEDVKEEVEEVIVGVLNMSSEIEGCPKPSKTASPKQGKKKPIYRRSRPCPVCGKEFSRACTLSRHIRTHTGEKPHKCSLCGKRFAEKKYLKAHQRVHTGEKPYPCCVCGKRFTQLRSKTLHEEKHLRVASENEEATEPMVKLKEESVEGMTNFNGLEIDWLSPVIKESPDHWDDEDVKLSPEPELTTEPVGLMEPVKQEESPGPDNPHPCSECGRVFPQPYELMLHQREHFRRQLFKCFFCSDVFNSKYMRNKHEDDKHQGEIPDECSSGRGSTTAYWSYSSHTGERLFQCSVCERRFSQSSHLKTHQRVHKDGSTVSSQTLPI